MSFVKNVFKGFAFAVPQTIETKLGNIASFAKTLSSSDTRTEVAQAFRSTKGILKEDYASVVTTGFNNTVKAFKTGKFYDENEASFDFGTEFGGDDNAWDTDWGDDSNANSESSTGSASDSGSSEPTADAFVIGSTIAKTSAGVSARLEEVTDAVVKTGQLNANLGRHNLVQQISANGVNRRFYEMSLARMDRDFAFRTSVQKPFYEANLQHLAAMQGFLGEISDRVADLKEGQKVVATATDIVGQIESANRDGLPPAASMANMFEVGGGFSLPKYINTLNRRLQIMATDSSFGMFSQAMSGGAAEMLMEQIVDQLIPKATSKGMSRIDDWFGNLFPMIFSRMDAKASALLKTGEIKDNFIGSVMKFFSGSNTPDTAIDLSNYSKDKAVAFDGYVHRAIVEVQPTLLGDIHAELIKIREKIGAESPQKSGIKAYNYDTGKFENTARAYKEFNKKASRSAMMDFNLFASRAGGNMNDDLENLFSSMVDKQVNFRNVEDIGKYVDSLKSVASATETEKASLDKAFSEITSMLTNNGDLGMSEDNRLRRMADFQAAIVKGGAQKEHFYRNMFDGQENITRSIFNSREMNGVDVRDGGKERTLEDIRRDRQILSNANQYNNDAAVSEDRDSKSILRNGDGKITLKTLYNAPFKVFDQFSESLQEYVNSYFFDTDRKNTKIGKFLDQLNDKFFGDSGIFSPLVKAFKDSSIVKNVKDGFNNVTNWLFGDFDPTTGQRGRSRLRTFMSEKLGALGSMLNSYLPEGTIKNTFTKGMTKLLSAFNVSADDISKAGGVTGYLKEAIRGQVDKFATTIFGTKNETTGLRDGGLAGGIVNGITKARDAVIDKIVSPLKLMLVGADGTSGLYGAMKDQFLTKFVAPIKNSLVGEDGKSGLFGSMKDQFNEKLFTPFKTFLFGTKDATGTRIKDGVLSTFVDNVQNQIIKPFKAYASNIYEGAKDGLMNNVVAPFKQALFGEKVNADDKRGIVANVSAKFGDALNYIQEKFDKWLFNPLKTFFTDPEKGVFTKLNTWLFDEDTGLLRTLSNYLFNDKNGLFTKMNEKLFSGKNSYFERFGNWLNDPQNGVLTKFGRTITAAVDVTKEYVTDLFERVKTNFLDPLKDEMLYIWRASKIYFKKEIWKPFKDEVKASWEGTKKFFKEEIFVPLKGTLQPFIEEAKYQWTNMKTHMVDIFKSTGKIMGDTINAAFLEGFGKTFTQIMRDNVLDPIKETLSAVKKFLTNALKQVLLAPIKMIVGASAALRNRHERMGMAYVSTTLESVAADTVATVGDDKQTKDSWLKRVMRRRDELANKAASAVSKSADATSKVANSVSDALKRMRNDSSASQNPTVSTGGTVSSPSSSSSTPASSPAIENKSDVLRDKISNVRQPKSDMSPSSLISKGFASLQGRNKSPSQPTIAGISDNLHEIKTQDKRLFKFLRENLRNVGNNLERIANGLGFDVGFENRRSAKKGLFANIKSGLFNFIKNPVSWVFNALTGGIGRVTSGIFNFATKLLSPVTKAVEGAFKVAGAAVKGFSVALGQAAKAAVNVLGLAVDAAKLAVDVTKAFVNIGGKLAEFAVNTLMNATEVVFNIVKGAGKMFGDLLFSTVKATSKIVGGLIEGAASITKSVVKISTGLISALSKVTSSLLDFAGDITGAVTTAIGGAIRGLLTGQRTNTNGMMGALTPVYVVGGYLAGTEGGASSLLAAKAEVGTRGLIGRIKRSITSKLFKNSIDFKEKMLKSSTSISSSLTKFGKGFKNTIEMLTLAIVPLTSMLKKFGQLGMLKSAMNSLGRNNTILGGGRDRTGRNERTGRDGRTARERLRDMRRGGNRGGLFNRLGRGLGRGAAGLGKGLLKGGITGLIAGGASYLMDEWADGTEDPGAKKLIKSGSRALSWGGTGAMIGSVIPGVGTAVGAGIGAIAGLIYENKDDLAGFAKTLWDFAKKGFTTAVSVIGEWAGKLKDTVNEWARDADEYIRGKAADAWAYTKDITSSAGEYLSKKWNAAKETISEWASDASDTVKGWWSSSVSMISSGYDWVTDKFKALYEGGKELFSDITNPDTVTNWWTSATAAVTGAYDYSINAISNWIEDGKASTSDAYKKIKAYASDFWSSVSDSVKDIYGKVKSWFNGDEEKPSKDNIITKDKETPPVAQHAQNVKTQNVKPVVNYAIPPANDPSPVGMAQGMAKASSQAYAGNQSSPSVAPVKNTSAIEKIASSSVSAANESTYATSGGGIGDAVDKRIDKFTDIINDASNRYGVDPLLIRAVIRQESGGNPVARSGVGAQGLMQLMPGTAKELGVTNPNDPVQNINGGVKYIARQLKTFSNNVPLALAAYNAGAGNVYKWGGVPQFSETQGYVRNIAGTYKKYTSMPTAANSSKYNYDMRVFASTNKFSDQATGRKQLTGLLAGNSFGMAMPAANDGGILNGVSPYSDTAAVYGENNVGDVDTQLPTFAKGDIKGGLAFIDKFTNLKQRSGQAKTGGSRAIDSMSNPVQNTISQSIMSDVERITAKVDPTGSAKSQKATAAATASTAAAIDTKNANKDPAPETVVSLDDTATAKNTADSANQLKQLNENFTAFFKAVGVNKAKAAANASSMETQRYSSASMFSNEAKKAASK